MPNIWISVPVRKNDVDLTDFVNKLTLGYTAPAKYDTFNPEDPYGDQIQVDHPHYGADPVNFANKVVFVNMEPGYQSYAGIHGVEDFGDLNLARSINKGINYAFENGADAVLSLSGPCDLDLFAIEDNYSKLTDKDVVNFSDGVAFMIKAGSSYRMDEQFKVWFWADDFFRRLINDDKVTYQDSAYFKINELMPLTIDTEALTEITNADHAMYDLKWSA